MSTARERLEAAEPAQSPAEYSQVICPLRCEAFAEHLAGMEVPEGLKRWAAFMTALHGPRVRVHRIVYDDWIVALLVVRYGEALYYWPAAFGHADLERARRWMHGEKPKAVRYVQADTPVGFHDAAAAAGIL